MPAAVWLKIEVTLTSLINVLLLQQYFIESTISISTTAQSLFVTSHHDYLLHHASNEILADGKAWLEYVPAPPFSNEARLRCTFRVVNDTISPVLWYRQNVSNQAIDCANEKYICNVGQAVEVIEPRGGSMIVRNYTLNIKEASPSDLGEYLCAINSSPIVGKIVSFYSRPNINLQRINSIQSKKKVDANPSEGEKITLQCSINWMFPEKIKSVEWSWRPASSPNFTIINDDFVEGYVDNTSVKGTSFLVLNSVKRKHRAVFQCAISNDIDNAYAIIYLRIRYPKAALWPFLGISAELLVLAIIIITSEIIRRRKQKDSEIENNKPSEIPDAKLSETKSPEHEQQDEIISILLKQSDKKLNCQQSVHVDEDVFQREDRLAPIAVPEDGIV